MPKRLKKTMSVVAALAIGAGALGGVSLFFATSMPSSSIAADQYLHGTVMFRERIALPPEARLTVELTDISAADATTRTIGQTQVASIVGSPIPFSISFDPKLLDPTHRYALQARISAGDTLWFVNDEQIEIEPRNTAKPVEIRVVMVRKSGDDSDLSSIEGKNWLVETIQGMGHVAHGAQTFTISPDGSVSGSGGCNRFFTKATLDGDQISFAEIGSTYIQCPTELMNQELKFLDVLSKTRSYRVDLDKLMLLDANGEAVATLSHQL
ncbi:META domain-containing protein [Daeguia caeni]|uniref:META domain-containing protein n=1 Tax=Daeguia caeni TaxID=439612 RepID=A0ABV9H1L0_9HYPH